MLSQKTASSNEDQQSNAEPSQSIVLATDDITIHERNASDQDDASQEGTSGQGHVAEETELVMDSQPPDILMEAIESARSSLNTSAVNNVIDESSSSDSQSDDPDESPVHTQSSDQPDGLNDINTTPSIPSTVTINPGKSPSNSFAPGREQRIDVSMDIRQKREPSHSGSVRCTSPVKRNISPERSVRHAPAHMLLPNSPVGGQIRGRSQEAYSGHHQDEGVGSKPKNVQRSKSLSSAPTRSKERSFQPIPSISKNKRHSTSHDREKKAAYDRRAAAYYVNAPQDRSYDVRNTHRRSDKVRSHCTSDSARPQPPDVSSSENLFDIISLVERVRSTSPKHSSKRKKKRSSSRKDGVFESKI